MSPKMGCENRKLFFREPLAPRKKIIVQRLRRIFVQIQGAAIGAYWNMQQLP